MSVQVRFTSTHCKQTPVLKKLQLLYFLCSYTSLFYCKIICLYKKTLHMYHYIKKTNLVNSLSDVLVERRARSRARAASRKRADASDFFLLESKSRGDKTRDSLDRCWIWFTRSFWCVFVFWLVSVQYTCLLFILTSLLIRFI